MSSQDAMKTTWPDYVLQEASEMPLCSGDCRTERLLCRKLLLTVSLVCLYV